MKVRISEVWNYRGEVKELAVIEANGKADVYDWISKNRPDLSLATGVNDHGFHAIAI